MKPAEMIQRWSSKPKKDNAERIRDNQRRHRARTKAYIVELERQLAEERAQNAALRSELEKLRAKRAESSPVNCVTESVSSRLMTLSMDREAMTSHNKPVLPTSSYSGLPSSPIYQVHSVPKLSSSLHEAILPVVRDYRPIIRGYSMSSPAKGQPLGDKQARPEPNHCNNNRSPVSATPVTTFSQENETAGVFESDYSYLPPPAREESTISCKAAYAMIKQQNYRGLDLGAFWKTLESGFRGPMGHGDGCRVNSNLVFSVIDAISSL